MSYLNSKPFVFGIVNSEIINKIDLSLDMPSLCASKLKDGTVDIGLVPVAVIPEIKGARIISDYCIGASGKVRTVILASDVPVDEIRTIILDYQSRTSVRLVQVLAKHHWKISPAFEKARTDYISIDIKGTTGGVIIGDRVFSSEKKFKYIYDLSEEWAKMTGLDFVFACWVSNKEIDPEFAKEFNKALKKGISSIGEVIAENEGSFPGCNLEDYYNENISYPLDEQKKKGLELFFNYNEKIEVI